MQTCQRLLPFACLSLLMVGRGAQSQAKEQERTSALVHGDFVVGTLFSVHHQPKQKQTEGNILSCGEVREMYGIQRVEAAFQTLDAINRDPALLPNLTLGLEIRDSCWYAPVALQQSIEFIRDAISPASGVGVGVTCEASASQQSESEGVTTPRKAPLVGVIGPASSSVAIQVQNLLQLFGIPQIGYSTTSKDLSDKSRFHYFLRVVPSDYYQAQVMVDIVRRYNWTYVSAVNTDENYGQSGIQAFRELAEKANICIAKEDSVLSNAEDEVFEGVLKKLDEDKNARVVVCFCEGMTVRGLLRATKSLNLTGRFLIIGSDGWADRSDVTEGYEREARGSISIRIHSPYVTSFDEYYFRLDPFRNARNPWFREFWQARFNCTMPPEGEATNGSLSSSEARVCTGEERLSDRYKQDPKLSFVIKAIYTMAYGLHNLHQDVCGAGAVGVCPALFPFNGSLFKSYLLNVTFAYGSDQELVEFDRRGDPPGRYNIMNYQLLPGDGGGAFDYIHVGDWHNGTLHIWDELQYAEGAGPRVESVCSRPCALGYYKNLQTGGQEQKCCWVCVPCNNNAILVDEMTCVACPSGHWPNANKTACIEIPVEFVQWSDTEAVVAIAFSCLGFIATFFAGGVFVRYNDTPVVKSSTRELSYLILAGMTLSHAATFPVLARPSRLSCSLSRLLPGLSFAMIYASLLTKTNRIARILAGSKKRFPTRKPRFMSATAQVCITCSLIGVEAGVAAAMLSLEPADATLQFPSLDRVVLACNTTPLGVLAPLAADFLLVLLCTLYAFKTRNVPENFNEAKFIGFAMYTTCVIWIAFVPIYFGSDSKIITMCMCVTLSAMVTLVFLFLPKIYIILVRPERNNRALFTTSKIRCHIGSRVASAVSNKSSNSFSSTDSPRDRLVALKKAEANHVTSRGVDSDVHRVSFPAQTAAWRASGDGDPSLVLSGLLGVRGAEDRVRRVECRTLSCQTGAELLQLLVKTYSSQDAAACKEKAPVAGWVQLSPRALLAATSGPCHKAHILEEDVSEASGEEDSGKLKNITINLGQGCSGCRPSSPAESAGSSAPDLDWSNHSANGV